jgi:hypothetical protein
MSKWSLLGIEEGMSVIDIIAAGGDDTEVLSLSMQAVRCMLRTLTWC